MTCHKTRQLLQKITYGNLVKRGYGNRGEESNDISTTPTKMKNSRFTIVGRPTVYSTQEEEVISHILQKMADWGYAINKDGLKEIVISYAEILKIPKFSS
ncbi:hypothetical protein BpHYR1_019021 [Brachionus plicatilis]|uniref:Uncharacterized protein n=1 Tax=Brachionus plicatilis TaxID=10195 RepID=A0A3M7T935_BRAPC|nr:hypothetical protein BpHYR1_019021 [Brachionus plicatilis]